MANDGRPLLLAIALHALLLLLLLCIDVRQPVLPPAVEPIQTYLYQAPKLPPATPAATPASTALAEAGAAIISALAEATAADHAAPEQDLSDPLVPEPDKAEQNAAVQTDTELITVPAELTTTPALQTTAHSVETLPLPGLAERALNRVTTVQPEQLHDAASASYQQFLEKQQHPKMTVERRHQQLSADPAQQVLATLNNGTQLIRTRHGCLIADPSKEGFDALMALKRSDCGDEVKIDALKQALDKHLKR